MTWQADQYFIQETLCNMNLQDVPSHPGTPMRESHPVTPEAGQYSSPDVDDPEEDLTSQANFDSEDEYTDATGHSGWSLPAKCNHRRNCAMCRERECAKRNFCQGGSTRGWKLAFSLFRESDQDESISYRDWRAEVEAALAKGYEPERVKIAMFEAMEGMAKDHAANIEQYGVLTALEILEGMDQLYRVSMTFQLLNAALCRLQQRATETCRDYYDRFTQITVLLRERHSNHFHQGELARMSKDCFYVGLRAKHRPMVVHLKDHPNSTPLDFLAALMENEQNDALANARYPLATSTKTTAGVHHTDHPRAPCHIDKQDLYADRKTGGYAVRQMQLGQDEHARDRGDAGEDGYIIRPVQLDAEPMDVQSDTESPMLDPNVITWMDQGFHCGMVQATDGADACFRRCFNCLEEGH